MPEPAAGGPANLATLRAARLDAWDAYDAARDDAARADDALHAAGAAYFNANAAYRAEVLRLQRVHQQADHHDQDRGTQAPPAA